MPCKKEFCIGSGVSSLVHPFIPSIYLSNHQPTYVSIFIHPTICPPTHQSISIHIHLSIYPIQLSTQPSSHPPTHIHSSNHPPTHSYPTISIHLSVYIHSSIHPRTSNHGTLCQAWSLLMNETQRLTLKNSCSRSPNRDINYSANVVEPTRLHLISQHKHKLVS